MDKAQVQQACTIIRELRAHAEWARESLETSDPMGHDLDTAAQLIGDLLDRIERLEIDRDALVIQCDYLQQRYLDALRAARGGDDAREV